MDDFQGLLDASDGILLFTIVSSFHHQGVGESFNNGAVYFLEASLLISASSEWQVDLSLDSLDIDVFHKGHVFAHNAFIGPSSEQQDLSSILVLAFLRLRFLFYVKGVKMQVTYCVELQPSSLKSFNYLITIIIKKTLYE